jgi:hypothetical protein
MISVSDEKTFNVLKYGLHRYLPIRIVIRNNNGIIEGLVEESISMVWSTTNVNIFWSGKAYSILGEHQLDGIADAMHNAGAGDLVIDPLEEDSPIEIDWERWLKATTKYSKRNAPFKVKEIQG